MKPLYSKLLFAAALLLLATGGSVATPSSPASAAPCDAVTQATPPVKPARRDSTKTGKKKQAKKQKNGNKAKTKQQDTTQLK